MEERDLLAEVQVDIEETAVDRKKSAIRKKLVKLREAEAAVEKLRAELDAIVAWPIADFMGGAWSSEPWVHNEPRAWASIGVPNAKPISIGTGT